ncbi:hypothetical protein BDV97DRAFT_370702 [Delphinella strobiligena]|nr:hypothetical protein BDV97DRAFT_370702 [Delphinella strobiligena]
MLKQHYSENIEPTKFKHLLDSYKDEVPQKLAELEKHRLKIIPEALSERNATHLTKKEVQTLVDWKLHHGTFRPSLQKLVASNSESAIEDSTKAAFAVYAKDHSALNQAVSMLAKDLKGIGPATASLLMSVYDSENAPFFSDELFQWMMFEDGKGNGWDRRIKYSIAEYKQMVPLVEAFRERLEKDGGKATALEVEMVAYVLGRRKDDVKGEAKDEKKADSKGEKKRTAAEAEATNTQEVAGKEETHDKNEGSSSRAQRAAKRRKAPDN